VILDLEDAVAPDAKAMAREQVVAAVKAGGFGHREVFIRVNGIETPWFPDDLNAAIAAAPDAILIPKISTPDQPERIGERLLSLHANLHTRVWAMIETPTAIFNVRGIAATAKDSETRLAGFVLGLNDVAKETRARQVPGRAPMLPWIATCVLAAREYGIDILDGVYNDIADAEGFAQECAQARDLGLDGKTLIHPNQIEACNAAFSPSAEEVAQSRKMIAAFELPENKDKGVVQIEGRMVERMHADTARRTVAIAEAIAGRG
jgi:citrate lyase subunit beta/citryl-CoA lyase